MRHLRGNGAPLVINVNTIGLLWPNPASMYTVCVVKERIQAQFRFPIWSNRWTHLLTVFAMGCSAYCWRWTSARHQKLVRIANVVQRLWTGNWEMFKIDSILANIRVRFHHRQLTTASLLKCVRMIWIYKIGSVLRGDFATWCHDCNESEFIYFPK